MIYSTLSVNQCHIPILVWCLPLHIYKYLLNSKNQKKDQMFVIAPPHSSDGEDEWEWEIKSFDLKPEIEHNLNT